MIKTLLLAAVAAAALTTGAQAATVNVTKTFDVTDGRIIGISGMSPNQSYVAQFFGDLDAPVDLQTGDVLDLTINFTGNLISLVNPPELEMYLLATEAPTADYDTTATLNFIGASGNLSSTNPKTDTQDLLGTPFFGGFQTSPGAVSFTGLRYHATIDSMQPDGQTFGVVLARIYGIVPNDTHLGIPYDPDFVPLPGNPGGAPEPATWALMLVGFGTAGALLRRRQLAPA